LGCQWYVILYKGRWIHSWNVTISFFPANTVNFWMNRHLTGKSNSGDQCLLVGKETRFPGTRESTSMVFTTDVKKETWLGLTEVYCQHSLCNCRYNQGNTPPLSKSFTKVPVCISSFTRQVFTMWQCNFWHTIWSFQN